jgi:hypothetical protein
MPVTVILPYRSRETQIHQLVPKLLQPGRNVKNIVIAEQANTDVFNRGAVKNAGFEAAVRALELKDSDTVCFHDVDVCPEDRFGDYPDCRKNEIWHLYGHAHCLGGVVCVTVGDFRKMGQFGFWDGWGREDTDLMQSAKRELVHVNHTRFVDRFKPSPVGFYELDANGRRLGTADVRALLTAKIAANKAKPPANTSLHYGPHFRSCTVAPSTTPNIAHFLLHL